MADVIVLVVNTKWNHGFFKRCKKCTFWNVFVGKDKGGSSWSSAAVLNEVFLCLLT